MPKQNQIDLADRPPESEELFFRQLYDAWNARVYSLAFYLTKSSFMSEEIAQEVFVKIWKNKDKLAQIEHLSAWIRTIVQNTTISYLRKAAREKLLITNYALNLPDHSNDTLDGVREKELASFLQSILNNLSPQQRKVYELTRIAGLTLPEAAEKMGVTRHTAKEHLVRALKVIRNKLDGHIELVVTAAIPLFL
ncbi:RNA polymerase sigma factor [Pseudobacter ginsenosidimutans]|uniref:RNA polymerase sigma factor n=1 Tax=Pseudobacter ginsenosidimutans TaxID=661488 RepID=A0A4Q7N693_9BACT|nr:sigma-70 family RNA polymerase sigma factor [Pseudobacter ginsenosidimutans]QEC45108.1 sigma-70 family RNA polymerase sigma factor [Pseudobacter ginsenosidimutans]RZS76604.1 RNA polymerase sigma-70 factor (ECF subfamily) [Pseudobacter ginsenosidimutans]